MLGPARYYAKIRNNQWLNKDRLKKLQDRKFVETVTHAYKTVPYYHRLFKEEGINPSDFHGLQDIHRIPILTKDVVKNAGRDMVSNGYDFSTLIKERTGGSTGKPLLIYRTKASLDLSKASKLRTFIANGYKLHHKIAVLRFYQVRPKLHHKLAIHREYFIAFDKNPHKPFEQLKKLNPDVIESYPSIMKEVAAYMRDNGLSLKPPKLIMSVSEQLTGRIRNLVHAQFGVDVTETYGTWETKYIAWECPRHEGLHVNSDLLHVQIVDPKTGEEVGHDEKGEVVLTDFSNPAMPFIRYNIEVLAVHTSRTCSCGRVFPLMKNIVGRKTDILQLPSGKHMLGHWILANAFADYNQVIQYKGTQKRNGSLHVEVILQDGTTIDEKKIIAKIKSMCENIPVKIKYVKNIARTSSGKYIVFSSEMKSR